MVIGKFLAVKLDLGIFESSPGKVRWWLLKYIKILQKCTYRAPQSISIYYFPG
jgi:hypothetical protein